MNSLGDKLRGLVAETLETEIAPGADVQRSALPAWDSLNHLRVVMAAEEEFHVRFDSDEITQIDSLSRFKALLEAKLAGLKALTA